MERDETIFEKLIIAAEIIRKKEFPFKQITKNSLGIIAECLPFLISKLDKLPKTKKFLTESIETRESFAVRKIWRIAESYRQKNIRYSKSTLLLKSGFYKLQNNPIIKKVVEDELSNQLF